MLKKVSRYYADRNKIMGDRLLFNVPGATIVFDDVLALYAVNRL